MSLLKYLSVLIFNIVCFSSINSAPLSTGKNWDSSGVLVSRLRRQANGFGISITRSSAQSDSSVPASGYLTAYGLNTYGNYNSGFGSGSGLDNQGSRYPGSYANAQSFASASSNGAPSYGPSSANALATAGATVNSGSLRPGGYNNFYDHPYYSPMGPYQYGGLGGFGGGYGGYGGPNYDLGYGGNRGGYRPGGFNSGGMNMPRPGPGPQSNNVGPGPAVPPSGLSGSGSKAQAAGSTQVEPISPPVVANVGTTSLGNPSVVKPDALPGGSSANINTEGSSSPIQPPEVISNTGSAESGSQQPAPIVSLVPSNEITNAKVESNTGSSGPGDGVVGPPSSPAQGTSHADSSANNEGAPNPQVFNPASQPTDTTGGSPGSSADAQAETSLQEDHRDVGSENSGGSHAETQSNAAASGNDGVSNANANANAISFEDY